MRKFLIIILFSISCITHIWGESASLTVNISNIEHNDGKIFLLLFNKAEGFPGKRNKALKDYILDINENKSSVVIDSLEYGQYALSLFHDENKNGRLDTNWIGIPNEGLGMSNNAKGSFGPPKFEDAAFIVEQDSVKIEIDMKY